ncbi:hypothetical protein [Tessaracoccus sp.]
MSNGSSNGGAPRDPSGGAGDGRAEDGYPTQAIPPHSNPSQGPPQQGHPGMPSGPSQQGYPPQGPRGYPQPGQSGPAQGRPGYPQQGQPGNPQGYGPPPQGDQYGQGQPPQGYGQQYPHGYDQGQSAYASPPRKSQTGMIVAIIAIIVALILAAVAWFVLGSREQQVVPTISSQPTAVQSPDVEPTPTEAITTTPEDPGTAGGETPPPMPEQVGDYAAEGEPEPEITIYTNKDEVTIVAIHVGIGGITDYVQGLTEPTEIGSWTCGVEPDSELNMCLVEAYGGVLSLTGQADAEALAAFGDEFLTTWK